MACERARREYVDAAKEAEAAGRRLRDFSVRFVAAPPRRSMVVDDSDFDTWEGLEQTAALTRQRSLEKLRAWRQKAALHRKPVGKRAPKGKALSVAEAQREYVEAEKEWVAAQERLREFEQSMGPIEAAPAEAPSVGSPGLERWNRLREEEAAARNRKLEKEKAYNEVRGLHR